ncbi:hypothetical protein Poli38472_004747 [Pythium oligandrum]|uniref:Uncharacterized protein n=1 Tax=Pythium oligandrum TaxID=41045 RepID=A0A8K1CBM2_PYTOL|nr:hypothetical protein Poli38472_004747 [Pythium oligandrum]|eukprot:TMW59678.1 hypothetical protein Poli38472_004747 [Pythium oligandrum]
MKTTRLVLGGFLCSHVALVAGHGFLTAPKVEFRTPGEDPTAYSATLDPNQAMPAPRGVEYVRGPQENAEAFATVFAGSQYATLRDLVMAHGNLETSQGVSKECGRTRMDAAPQPLPEMVVWQHGDGEGFTLSHEGPCEIWCDDERVFYEANCARTYPGVPAKLPYEREKCIGKKRLQMIWIALHEGWRWQVYANCAQIESDSTTAEGGAPAVDNSSEQVVPLGQNQDIVGRAVAPEPSSDGWTNADNSNDRMGGANDNSDGNSTTSCSKASPQTTPVVSLRRPRPFMRTVTPSPPQSRDDQGTVHPNGRALREDVQDGSQEYRISEIMHRRPSYDELRGYAYAIKHNLSEKLLPPEWRSSKSPRQLASHYE